MLARHQALGLAIFVVLLLIVLINARTWTPRLRRGFWDESDEDLDGGALADGRDSYGQGLVSDSKGSEFFEEQADAFLSEQARAADDLQSLLTHIADRLPPPRDLVAAVTARNYLHVKCMCYTGLGNRLPGLVGGFGLALADSWSSNVPRVAVVEYPLGGCRGAAKWWEHDGLDWEWPRRGKCTTDAADGEPEAGRSDDEFENLAPGSKPPVPETIGHVLLLLSSGHLPAVLHSLFPAEYPAQKREPPRRARNPGCLPVPGNMDGWIFHDDNHLPSHILPLLKSNLSACQPGKLWRLWTGDYLLPLLEANPNYAPWFLRTFPRGNAFYMLSRRFWRPAKRLKAEADEFISTSFGNPTIGMHVRTLKNRETAPSIDVYLDAALSVARSSGGLSNELVAGGKSADPRDEEAASAMRIFLATDTANLEISKAIKPFVVFKTPPESLAKMNEQENPSTDDEGVVDLLLLGACSAIVTTFGSSFGNVAASLAGKMPYVALHNGVGGMLTLTRAMTSEPCTFHSSGLLRWAESNKDFPPDIEFPPWYKGSATDRAKEESWASEAGKLWKGYYGHRSVGECHW